MKRPLHAKPNVSDSFDIPSYNWIVLWIWDEISLGFYLMELAGLNGKVLPTLHGLSFISRPGLPRSINGIIVLLVLIIRFLFS